MQKNALIRELKSRTGLTQREIKRFMNAFSGAVTNSLSADQKVTISGLGTFEIRQRKRKSIINPNNPFERIVLPQRKVVKYLAGKTIKDDVNKLVDPKKSDQALIQKSYHPTTKDEDTEGEEESIVEEKPIKKTTTPKQIYTPLEQKKYPVKTDKNKDKAKIAPEQEQADKKSIDELVEEISEEVERKDTISPVENKTGAVSKSQPQITKNKIPPLKQTQPPKRLPPAPAKPTPQNNKIAPQPPKTAPTIQVSTPSPPPPSKPPTKQLPSPPPKPTSKSAPSLQQQKSVADLSKKRKFVQKPVSAKTEPKKGQLPKGIKIPYIDLSKKTIDKKTLSIIPEYIARLYQAVPVETDPVNKKLIVAMVDPEDYQAREFIKKKTGFQIEPRLATSADIGRILDQYSGIETEVETAIKGTEFAGAIKEAAATAEGPAEKKEEVSSEAPTSRVVQSLLRRAVSSKASDIHIEPEEGDVNVRFRIDGVLQKVITLPKKIQPAIASRIKILSGMKIDETRLPQDGRFEQKIHGREIDFRVSTFPSVNGEKIVMRILDKSTGILSLDELGLTGDSFKRLDKAIHESHGMTLVTGPTGSGKTTTLYAVIDRIMDVGINIVTLEDPVEYQIKGINQGQVRADIDFTFAKGLRSIVRQDPDVIMVGEIRDLETAEMAVHAALTGHIVLSTLHTNDAAGAIPRLVDMGVEPFLLTSSLSTVVGQRLARKICDQCKVEAQISEEIMTTIKKEVEAMPEAEAKKIQGKQLKFYKGKGCQACNKSGYKGRIGLFEVLAMSPEIEKLTIKKSSADMITKKAIEEGMVTMKQDGILKALEGKTSIEEVWRVTKE